MQLHRVPLDEIDLSDVAFWRAPRVARESAFKTLRDEAPVRFFEEREFAHFPKGPGYFALTRHEDIWHVSRNPQLFCSGKGSNIGDLPQEINDFFGSMINMDDPRHFRLRSIVSKGFTPREIGRVDRYVRDKAARIVDGVLERHGRGDEFDAVAEISGPFPLQIICEMMGIPPEDEERIFAWTNTILGAGDPDFGGTYDSLFAAGLGMFEYAQALGEDRRARPREDITSAMMGAEGDGDRLSPQEFGSFFILLVVAGNETTRNAISHGLLALTQHPDQRERWFGDFEAVTRPAVEEIVRWATPVIHFRRTATRDTEIRGTKIAAGDKLVLWYNSGNRDDAAYADPFRFDVTRQPNPAQIGFGAGGPHFCRGANLARREIAGVFDEIRRRLPNLRI
ncbi:MAG: cytochrome P450, partial [Acidimicrobiia bacterium]